MPFGIMHAKVAIRLVDSQYRYCFLHKQIFFIASRKKDY